MTLRARKLSNARLFFLIEAADAAIKKAVSALAEYDTKLQARDIKESPAEVVVDDVVE